MSETRIKFIHGDEYNILIDCLRSARRAARLTQVELGERLGTDQSYISKYERGERRLDVVEVRAICAVFGIPLADFVRDFEERLKSKGLS
jgi:transcriptional regulator with XRE-family HTH domain